MDSNQEMLRHTVATLAYRGAKTLRGAAEDLSGFSVRPGTRTPEQLLAHIGDLLDWALAMAKGTPEWRDSKPLAWKEEVERFFAGLRRFR